MSTTYQTDSKEPVTNTSGPNSGNTSRTSLDEYATVDDYGSPGWNVSEKTALYWKEVYENAKYEGRHRYDPSYKWTAAEEKKLLRKVCSPPAVPWG